MLVVLAPTLLGPLDGEGLFCLGGSGDASFLRIRRNQKLAEERESCADRFLPA